MPNKEKIGNYGSVEKPENVVTDDTLESSRGGVDLEASEVDSENNAEARREASRVLGSRILANVGFEKHQTEIVESSFEKMKRRGEKLPGKNSQRRDYAYFKRLEDLVDQYGNEMEQKLWNASVDKLIIKPENITDSYWSSQEQILRDNGRGHTLNERAKMFMTQHIQEQQRDSLATWSNYLSDKDSPYPMWFKVYAWDGVSKMGTFDKDKKVFQKRNESTVAPYPKLNAEVLAKTYNVIEDFYENGQNTEERDERLDALVRSGNFNKLYSKILLDTKVIPKTPERTEDVHGKWIEYLPGEEEKLAEAAEGTGWCVADPGTGGKYLESENQDSKAKFLLLHLVDSETGQMADNGCASIRLDARTGEVAEISGLGASQDLEPALLPIVEEKVKSLPGGEKYLEAFADKRKLIELDRKMQQGEALNQDDIDMIFETKRDLHSLSSFTDPRINELREYAFFTVDDLCDELSMEQIVDKLLPAIDFSEEEYDEDAEDDAEENHYDGEIIDNRQLVLDYTDWLTEEKHAPWEAILQYADNEEIMRRMLTGELIENGASYQMIVENVDWIEPWAAIVLYENGVTDEALLASKMSLGGVLEDADILEDAGLDIKKLVDYAREPGFGFHIPMSTFRELIDKGVDPAKIANYLKADDIVDYAEELQGLGLDLKQIFLDNHDVWYSSDEEESARWFHEAEKFGVTGDDYIKHYLEKDSRTQEDVLADFLGVQERLQVYGVPEKDLPAVAFLDEVGRMNQGTRAWLQQASEERKQELMSVYQEWLEKTEKSELTDVA